jgi:hypothetical protein
MVINAIPYTRKIIDIGHTLIKRTVKSYHPEILIIILIGIFSLISEPYMWENGLIQLTYFMLYRGLTIWLTILPCLNEPQSIRYFGLFGGHNDYLPLSGHIGVTWILCYYISKIFGYFSYLLLIWQSYLLIAERRHYSIELINSMVLMWAITKMTN